MADLTLTNISKSYGSLIVLRDVSLSVADGSFCALLGPSGSGKTTVLRTIAGFAEPEAGCVIIGNEDVTDLAANRRDIGIVFQSYALFPHLTVFENVAFGLRIRRLSAADVDRRVRAVLNLVGMASYESRRPAQLSGGQQQRVALARALVIEPKLLLLDEPLSALDRKIREEMRDELKRVHRETGMTTIMVTHDQEEAIDLADRLVVMKDGEICQGGTPADIYHAPGSHFVADFMGGHRLPPGQLTTHGADTFVRIGGLELPVGRHASMSIGDQVQPVLQPEYVTLKQITGEAQPAVGGLVGQIRDISFYGSIARSHVEVEGIVLPSLMFAAQARTLASGSHVSVCVDAAGLHCFAPGRTD
jgi:spermidine/putrescine ABC transporter ATP-binding subunit